ncbi:MULTISPECIES: AMP-dependent synthetase/ligase [unclassified Kribbella]|uniref:AMP-dependent synthetase/ligase n=1 Tax=unclassified Kribbella TaxID=2644121 RepID=UPI003019F44D
MIRTIAELPFVSAERFGDRPALQYRSGGGWQQQSFSEVGVLVDALARGFAASGVGPGDRVCILAETTPEWTLAALGVLSAAGVVVPIYATSSAEECAWVITDSGARIVVCTDAARDRIEGLAAQVISLESGLESLAQLGAGQDLEDRRAAVQPTDPALIIYTSGTTGPPKGCVLTHRNWLRIGELTEELNYVRPGDVVYLFLPLAHVFAQMVQFASLSIGATLVYWGGDITRIVPELVEVRPTFLPAVPRIFEKLYAAMTTGMDPAAVRQAVSVGLRIQQLQREGTPLPTELAAAQTELEPLFAKVRGAFGGRLRQALCGAAPIAQEVLEFFHAAGVPVLEGYGMTETTGVGTVNEIHLFKAGSVGRPTPGVELRLGVDGEIEMRGPHVFAGYWNNPAATEAIMTGDWIRTGDLGEIDADGFVRITGRAKDIIITSGGKNLSPANLENDLRQSPWISHAIVYGDRRPYPIALLTVDPDAAGAAGPDEVLKVITEVVDAVNARYSKASQIKRFAILDRDLTVETGELTPSMKVKRQAVANNHATVIESLYT